MARIYSTRLAFAPSLTGGPHTVYTTPTGLLAVVKCMTVVWGDVRGSGLDAWAEDDAGCKLFRQTNNIGFQDDRDYGGSNLYYGTWVFPEATSLVFQTAAGTVDMTASGYVFDAP